MRVIPNPRLSEASAPPPNPHTQVVFFSLDDVLFDHTHSLECGIAAVHKSYPGLSRFEQRELVNHYRAVLEEVPRLCTPYRPASYQAYLKAWRVETFFSRLRVQRPTPTDIQLFLSLYEPAYKQTRVATPGAANLLAHIRRNGIRVAVSSATEEKMALMAKCEAIGIAHLVDEIIGSDTRGGLPRSSPSHGRILGVALDVMHVKLPGKAVMVGTSIQNHIEVAEAAGMRAVLYTRDERHSMADILRAGRVIRHLQDLPAHLGICNM